MTNRRLRIACALPMSFLMGMSATAYAQTTTPPGPSETPAPPAADAGDAGDGDIIVTATRENTTLNRTPAAVTAITSAALAPGGVTDMVDLGFVVPNVSIGQQQGTNRTFIRGVGLVNSDVGGEGAVAFLQNGAIITRPAAQLSGFFDLEQVEVLRGPQSILYGRGATAGAINLVTKRPTEQLDGYVRATYGNYNNKVLEGAVGGAIVGDTLLIRLAGKYENRDGYGKNLFTGQDVDDRNAYSLRGTLLAKLSNNFSATIVADYTNEDDNNYKMHFIGTSIRPLSALPNKLIGGVTIYDYYAARGQTANIRNTYANDGYNKRHGYSFTGTLDWDIGDANVKSITSYRTFVRSNLDDSDASNVDLGGQTTFGETSKTFSQEFVGSYKGNGFSLLGGAMYLHENLSGGTLIKTTNFGVLFGLPANTFDNGVYQQQGTVKIDAVGIYLQAAVDLTSTVKLTAGARYNYEHRQGTGFFRFDPQGVNVPTNAARGWGSVTPKVLLEYRPNDATMLYASVTKGFKSGVINVGSTNPVINPETVWSYEGGFKLRFANDRVQLNGAVFYYDYKDLQVSFVNASNVVQTINAASARNFGAELELEAKVTRQFRINLNASYLNAEFTKFCNAYYGASVARPGISYAPCPGQPGLVDLSGKTLSNAPRVQAGGGFDWDIPLGDGKVTASADAKYQSKTYFREFNNVDAEQDGYAIVNASLTYRAPGERWSLGIWGKNLTDKFVVANNFIAASTYGYIRLGSLLPPRTYGATVSVKF